MRCHNYLIKFIIFLIITSFISVRCFSQPATITMWKDSVIGAIYNEKTATVAYGKKDAKGFYKIYLSDLSGKNERMVTYAGWKFDRHQWAEEWHPSGEYLFCYVEKSDYAKEKGHKRSPNDAIPGYGGYTDVWLLSRDGKQAWQLTNLANDYDHGVIHGAISRDGTMFAWTERIQSPKFLDKNLMAGSYVFKVADFILTPTPKLTNIRTFQPGNVLAGGELESISNDKTTLSFYSTFETKNLFATPVYTLNMITGEIKRLSFESFAQAPTYTPNGKRLVYMTGRDCHIFPFEIQGADWWIINVDGTNNYRLTFMNVKDHPQSVNHYRLAGSLSFISDSCFLGGVMTHPLGLTGYTAKVTFK
jgi:Tol biopolymer transport system component